MIKRIKLHNFRNYTNLDIKITKPINIFIGSNGQGKTNLLESIFFISMLRSFRTSKIKDLSKLNSKGFAISAEYLYQNSWTKLLEVDYCDVRRLKIDGKNIQKASDFIRQIRTVIFSPEDIRIVTDNSAVRRRFINMFIALLEPEYLLKLNLYTKALDSRNKLLRTNISDINILKAYEEILAVNGTDIITYRKQYLEILSIEIINILKSFNIDNFDIKYKTTGDIDSTDKYLMRFNETRQRDIDKKYTSFGPQLDDFDFVLNNKSLRQFGSTGQCRLISLCLKLANVNIFAKKNNKNNNVIVLVDDVTGELDQKTKDIFYQVITQAEQLFFTFTERPKDKFLDDCDIFEVNNGCMEKYEAHQSYKSHKACIVTP